MHAGIDTIFGLHGLPLPKLGPKTPVTDAVAVTPAVIAAAYDVGLVDVNRGGRSSLPTAISRPLTLVACQCVCTGKNIQAVAEFQDQFMNKDDLVEFFSNEASLFPVMMNWGSLELEALPCHSLH